MYQGGRNHNSWPAGCWVGFLPLVVFWIVWQGCGLSELCLRRGAREGWYKVDCMGILDVGLLACCFGGLLFCRSARMVGGWMGSVGRFGGAVRWWDRRSTQLVDYRGRGGVLWF